MRRNRPNAKRRKERKPSVTRPTAKRAEQERKQRNSCWLEQEPSQRESELNAQIAVKNAQQRPEPVPARQLHRPESLHASRATGSVIKRAPQVLNPEIRVKTQIKQSAW